MAGLGYNPNRDPSTGQFTSGSVSMVGVKKRLSTIPKTPLGVTNNPAGRQAALKVMNFANVRQERLSLVTRGKAMLMGRSPAYLGARKIEASTLHKYAKAAYTRAGG